MEHRRSWKVAKPSFSWHKGGEETDFAGKDLEKKTWAKYCLPNFHQNMAWKSKSGDWIPITYKRFWNKSLRQKPLVRQEGNVFLHRKSNILLIPQRYTCIHGQCYMWTLSDMFLHTNPLANSFSEVQLNLRLLILNALSDFFVFSLLFVFFNLSNGLWEQKTTTKNPMLLASLAFNTSFLYWPVSGLRLPLYLVLSCWRRYCAFSFSLHPLLPQLRYFTGRRGEAG